MKIKSGDIILVGKKRSIIRKIMNLFQKDPVKYNHVMLAKNNIEAYEAGYKIRKININKKLNKSDNYIIIRYKKLTKIQLKIIKIVMETLIGLPYGCSRLFLQLLDHITGTNKFTKILKSKWNQVCSSLIAYAYYVACNVEFNNVKWNSCDPDDIDDHIQKNPNDWIIVKKKD